LLAAPAGPWQDPPVLTWRFGVFERAASTAREDVTVADARPLVPGIAVRP